MIKEERKLQDKVKYFGKTKTKGFTYSCNCCDNEVWIPYSKKNPTGLCYKCSRKKYILNTNPTKICSICKQEQDLSKFVLLKDGNRKAQCTKCLNLRKYNINKNDFDKLLFNQNNVCAICEEENDYNSLNVDHDHITGKVRGLLCGSCNKGLGLFSDNPELLIKASKYLNE
jgi:hypothetical protein